MKIRENNQDKHTENQYEIMINLDETTKKIYEKHFKTEEYQFLANEATLLFVKKQKEKVKNEENEKSLIQLVLNMAKKYFHVGILYIDLTNEMNEILKKSEAVENFNVTDNHITLLIKQAFETAIINKNTSTIPKTSAEEN